MTYFSASYTDFIKFNRKPNEDFYLISSVSPIFTVADGVTQGRFESGAYAFPTGARAAAQIFCYTNLEFLEKNIDFKQKDNLGFNKALIEKSFNLANRRIKELNINEGINKKLNYFDYDWFDAVGALGFILGNNLYYGFVGDCGLAIFNKANQLKFQTKDEVQPFLEKAKKIYKNWGELSFKQKSIIQHKDFRNSHSGQGYGSFSGEEGVKKYYQIDRKSLNEGDLVIFYSDGFSDYFKEPVFIEILRRKDKKSLSVLTLEKAKNNPLKYGTDRTLISINF
ncbi:MAG: PP2C family serine/threonine-protein phosphatase [Candidatus Nealsonbacteria bacterium]|nr:PP2C family serine/threonine-protein phosphatase [Candidatus Nealsonbacteria bacterium]